MVQSGTEWHKVEGKEVKTAFLGEYRHNLDAKNRLIIPARFREALSPAFYVTRGLDGCLAVYNSDAWQAKMAELAKLPHTKREVRLYIRSITSKAVESELDGQGRLQLPQFLVDIAGIDKPCVIVGCSDYFEIWSEQRWDSFDSEADDSFEANAEAMTELLEKL
ncbi:MAG: division/cell wall cluster transcriptional repressor MraZ [Solobacterium sp.]|nr:division/cell wall cluster transcriptional repressor MraZ [Solobacterium sp.]MCH4048136.1 division/cell wall cluster transcriptional repressor MraZ [Solobacterium sp.]MCH4075010.1 division/cell wall cluster transcriptional repressor MraZ [Solobacterium sp.]MCI1314232.1 division/cell wall cluster transcriptional repressor MraZ [Solobacterium sp.]MCI1408070.1 division/cell wall cluster transcriptional repressor MraZ [Solobacterium sp.]